MPSPTYSSLPWHPLCEHWLSAGKAYAGSLGVGWRLLRAIWLLYDVAFHGSYRLFYVRIIYVVLL